MSENAQQDVVINLRVESDKRNRSATSAIENDVKSSADRIGKIMGSCWDRSASANEAANQRIKAGFAKLAADAATASDKEAKAAERASQARIKATEKATAAAEKQREREIKATEKAADADEKAKRRAENSLTRLEGKILKQGIIQERQAMSMIRGAGHMTHAIGEVAEGLALVGITSEEDTAKFIRMFAAVKGIAEIFNGVVSATTTLVHLTTAYERSLHAAKVEEEAILALEKARVAAGVAGSVVGRGAGGAEGGALGLAEEGATVVGGTVIGNRGGGWLARAKGLFGAGAAGAAEGAAAKAAPGFMSRWMPSFAALGAGGVGKILAGSASTIGGGISSVVGGMAGGGGLLSAGAAGILPGLAAGEALSHFGRGEGTLHALGLYGGQGWWQATKGRDESEEAFKHMDEATKERKKQEAERDEKYHHVYQLESQSRSMRRSIAQVQGRGKAFDQTELATARGAVAGDISRNKELTGHGEYADYGKLTVDLERLKTVQEHIADTDKQRVESLREQAERQKDLIKQGEEQVAQARRLVEQEKKRFQGTGARYAQLDAPTKAAVHSVVQKMKGGKKLNDIDARILQQAGVGQDLVNQHFFGNLTADQRGDLSALGEDSGIRGAQSHQTDVEKSLNEARAQEAETAGQLADANKTLLESMQNLANTVDQTAEITANRGGLKINLQPPAGGGASAAPATTQRSGARTGGAGDTVSELVGMSDDVEAGTGELVVALRTLMDSITKRDDALKREVSRAATQTAMNAVG